MSAGAIDFSVVLPLRNHQGHARDSLESWLRQEGHPHERYRVIVVSDGDDPELDRAISERLGSDDCMLHDRAARNVFDLYARGADAADGQFVVFTESHCLAAPDCLLELARHLDAHEDVIASCRTEGLAPNHVADVDSRMDVRAFESFATHDDWRALSHNGVAIERQTYHALGGHQGDLANFAWAALALRATYAGIRLGYSRRAVVHHWYRRSVRKIAGCTVAYARGEARFRATTPRAIWEDRLPVNDLPPGAARPPWSTTADARRGLAAAGTALRALVKNAAYVRRRGIPAASADRAYEAMLNAAYRWGWLTADASRDPIGAMVEVPGVEPGSSMSSAGLLRAQPVGDVGPPPSTGAGRRPQPQ